MSDPFPANTLRLEVLNHAVRNIPPEHMRMHVCWGNSAAPHTRDPELREIVDLLLTARPLGLSFVDANPRHAHEWSVWRDVTLPAGKGLIPDLVAERLMRYASVVGREQVRRALCSCICRPMLASVIGDLS